MSIAFRTRTRLQAPVETVYAALTDPEQLCRYFTDSASGPLVAGSTVSWRWGGDESALEVVEAESPTHLVLRWQAYQVPDVTTVRFDLQAQPDGSTVVIVSEAGWDSRPESLDSAFEHCAGWQHMLMCLKAWLHHGIDLR